MMKGMMPQRWHRPGHWMRTARLLVRTRGARRAGDPGAVVRLREVLGGLQVFGDRMSRNLELTGGSVRRKRR